MNGIERVKAAMALQELDRAPWVPFVGCHAAALIEMDAINYFKSADAIVRGADLAITKYKADGIPVTFDLQIEAEVLGCGLDWALDNPPAVISHPLINGMQLNEIKVPLPTQGRIPIVLEATRRIKKMHPEVALYGLITGPFTLGLHLWGTDIFINMFDNPEAVHEVMSFCADVAVAMSNYYLEAGADVIALVDPMTSQIDSNSFEEFVFPYCKRIFDNIREQDKLSSFFVCGNAKQNIEVMCDCRPDNISIDENIPLDYVRDIALTKKVSFGGNLKLTVCLLMGTTSDCEYDALDCIETGGRKGFILAPGCDIPMATPPENIRAVVDLLFNPYAQEVLKAAPRAEAGVEKLDVSNRYNQGKIVVDIITLDSLGCAPCQYMVNAVARAVEGMEDRVVWYEHKIKEKEGVQMMVTLGVSNIPTICINGKVEFISQIPPVKEITERIKTYL